MPFRRINMFVKIVWSYSDVSEFVVVRKQRFAPDSAGGGYSAPPDPQARIQRLTSKEKEGSGRKGEGSMQ